MIFSMLAHYSSNSSQSFEIFLCQLVWQHNPCLHSATTVSFLLPQCPSSSLSTSK
jgi:hypothetical protein